MVATEVLSELNIFKVVGTGFVGLDPFEPVARSCSITKWGKMFIDKSVTWVG